MRPTLLGHVEPAPSTGRAGSGEVHAKGKGRLWLAVLILGAASVAPDPAATVQEASPAEEPWMPGQPIPSLSRAYRGQFLIGTAVSSGMVQTGDAPRFLEHQFNAIVAEREMKPIALSEHEGQYDFAAADALVDWAGKHAIKVRGHCLVWHQEATPWMFSRDGKPVSRDQLIERMRVYIHDVVGHFKGRIWAWDVVNEAFVTGEAGAGGGDGWRRSAWYDIIGPEFITLAFQFAHEADPGALLFYNDYETQSPAKRSMILELIRSMQQKGVTIDGIGHQSHYSIHHPDPADLEITIREIAKLGLRNHITEMDISLREHWRAPVPVVTSELRALQGRRWAEFFRMFRRNRDKIDAVLFWGVNDENSWLRPPDEPLLFKAFRPKPAFWAVLQEARRRVD